MKLRIFSLALWGATNLCIIAPGVQAQELRAVQGPTVRSIDVQYVGPQAVSKEKILANMQTRVGRPYSAQTVQEDIRRLSQMGPLSNVRIFGEPAGDGVKVVVVVVTKRTVSELLITGAGRIKESKLREDLTTKPGESLSESALEGDRQKILEKYRKKGFSDIDVSYRTDGDEKKTTVRVIFEITEGAKTKIDDVLFEGNTVVKRSELLKVIKTKPKGLLNLFSSTAGKLNSERSRKIAVRFATSTTAKATSTPTSVLR